MRVLMRMAIRLGVLVFVIGCELLQVVLLWLVLFYVAVMILVLVLTGADGNASSVDIGLAADS